MVAGLTLLSASERKVKQHAMLNITIHFLPPSLHQLCQSVGLQPREYIACKTDILRNSALKHNGYPGKLKLPRHLSSEQRSKLMNFFSKSGWS